MPITLCTAKPVTVEMCGPWDGTPESSHEIAAFTGGDNWSTRTSRTDANTLEAELWDAAGHRWVDVPHGHHIVKNTGGGYHPIAPDVREHTYTTTEDTGPVADTPGGPFDFGQAMLALKAGHRAWRTGWHGKGMWIAMQPPGEMDAPYTYIALPPDGDGRQERIPWTVSQADAYAEDWHITRVPF